MISKKTYNQPLNLNDDTNSVTGLLKTSNVVTNPSFNGTVTAGTGVVPTSGFAQLNGSTARTMDIKDSATATSHPIVVSGNPSTHGLMIVRGNVTGTTGAITVGEGFTASRTGAGAYTLTWSTAFVDAPAVAASINSSSLRIILVPSVSTTTATISTNTTGGVATDTDFCFIAIAQRGA